MKIDNSINGQTAQDNPVFARVKEIFADNGIYYDFGVNGNEIEIDVVLGDWKHDHIRLRNAMLKGGCKLIDKEITGEDGGDCYSARYTYTI